MKLTICRVDVVDVVMSYILFLYP